MAESGAVKGSRRQSWGQSQGQSRGQSQGQSQGQSGAVGGRVRGRPGRRGGGVLFEGLDSLPQVRVLVVQGVVHVLPPCPSSPVWTVGAAVLLEV